MATDDPFVGKWRFSTKKSNYNGLRIRYEKAGEHSYKFYDANEVAHEKIADGKEHPGEMGNTYLVRQDNATTWIFITKEPDGTVLNTTRKVTNNGRTMTATWHDTKPDGKVETGWGEWRRIGSGQGLEGTWENTGKGEDNSTTEMVVTPYDSDGLTFSNPSDKEHQSIKFDGKDYPDIGPQVTKGSVASATRIDSRTIEEIDKIDGRVVDKQEIKVSSDGKTMTQTIHPTTNGSKTVTNVWERF